MKSNFHYPVSYSKKEKDGLVIKPEKYPAFTVAELGEMFPNGLWSLKKELGWEVGNSYIQHVNWLKKLTPKLTLEEADTEADARAKMLIYLLENGLLK
jgi:hypothetical protein